MTILLVPHVFGATEESDAAVCKKVYEDLRPRYGKNIACVEATYDTSEIKHIIGACEFFVGSRMHACIAAVSQHVPAVAIAYSDKFVGVLQTVGVEFLVADARTMDEAAILKHLSEAYEQRHGTRRTLAAKMPQAKGQILELFNEFYLGEPNNAELAVPVD